MDENIEAFVVHVVSFISMIIHLAREAQIVWLLIEKIIVSDQYSDHFDIFPKESAGILPEHTKINKYAIKLENG